MAPASDCYGCQFSITCHVETPKRKRRLQLMLAALDTLA